MRHRTTIAGLFAAGLLLAACGGDADPDPAAVTETDTSEATDTSDTSADDQPPDAPSDTGAQAAPEATDAGDTAESSEPSGSTADGATADTADDAAMEPASERLAEPCAEHAGREGDAFIDLVAPVDEQVAQGSVEIVGCANVFEATVAWTLLDGDGRTLDEGFTTAACGTGCVGEFRDTIPLETAADEPVAYLQVFSPNVSDEGPDQLHLTEVMVTIG